MPGEEILIVDDNATSLRLSRILSELGGYAVRTAANAEDALRLLSTFTPKVILMDIQLPGMDGLELTRRLKANSATKDIVILAFTACVEKKDQENARAAGCDGYIAKPIGVDALRGLISKHLESQPAAR